MTDKQKELLDEMTKISQECGLYDKQIIIDEERMFECVWCKYGFKESDANFILSENPNECVCSGCITEWADNLLCDLKRKEQECEELKEQLEEESKLGHKAVQDEADTFFDLLKVQKQLDQLKADNKHLNDLLNQALKELEQSREAIKKVKEIANSIINNDVSLANLFSFIVQIDNICDEVTE